MSLSFVRPCPVCRTPVDWATITFRPFCSERCRTQDLAAWSREDYRLPEKPDAEMGEGWSEGASDMAD